MPTLERRLPNFCTALEVNPTIGEAPEWASYSLLPHQQLPRCTGYDCEIHGDVLHKLCEGKRCPVHGAVRVQSEVGPDIEALTAVCRGRCAGEWDVWLLRAGRGSGKTLAGSVAVIEHLRKYGHAARVGIGGPTKDHVRDVCAEGETGLITLFGSEFTRYNRGTNEAWHYLGGYVKFMGAERPTRWNGPQWSFLWWDELALCRRQSWEQADLGLRLGEDPRAIATTTPKGVKWVKTLEEDRGTQTTVATTYDNPFLPKRTLRRLTARYAGTSMGEQELLAGWLDVPEGAIFAMLSERREYFLRPAPAVIPVFAGPVGVFEEDAAARAMRESAGAAPAAAASQGEGITSLEAGAAAENQPGAHGHLAGEILAPSAEPATAASVNPSDGGESVAPSSAPAGRLDADLAPPPVPTPGDRDADDDEIIAYANYVRTGTGVDWGTTEQHQSALATGSLVKGGLEDGAVWIRRCFMSPSGSSTELLAEARKHRRDQGSRWAAIDRSQWALADFFEAGGDVGPGMSAIKGDRDVEWRIGLILGLLEQGKLFFDLQGDGVAEAYEYLCQYHRGDDGEIVEEEDDIVDAIAYLVAELVHPSGALPAEGLGYISFTEADGGRDVPRSGVASNREAEAFWLRAAKQRQSPARRTKTALPGRRVREKR